MRGSVLRPVCLRVPQVEVARGILRVEDAGGVLVAALAAEQLAGAALDRTAPDPLPADRPLLKASNAIVTLQLGGRSLEAGERRWRLFRENVRRFVNGERLLCVVEKS